MKVFALAASLRRDSWNRRLVELAARLAKQTKAKVDLADFREFDMPFYDGDVEVSSGLPPGAVELGRRIKQADCVMIASPEYNYSMPGVLKNAIDWLSRANPTPMHGKVGLLMSASPSLVGGARGLLQLRVPLEACGMHLHPTHFTLSQASKAFDDDGGLKDTASTARLSQTIAAFLQTAQKLKAKG
jgi:NAD(P)H-dependent FMN reductase